MLILPIRMELIRLCRILMALYELYRWQGSATHAQSEMVIPTRMRMRLNNINRL